MQFLRFYDCKFDYIFAQSVFTHLKEKHIIECLQNIESVMKENSIFYFTYNNRENYIQTGLKDFCYPLSFFQNLSHKYNYILEECSDEYSHPRGQSMLSIRKCI